METWELTEYERERQPQEIALDSQMVISPRSLYREIVCPICLNILSQARAAPDCLHRFCKKCIEKAVRKDCPICRRKLPSQLKSFRADPNFDQLISKIYDDGNERPQDSRIVMAPEYEVILRPINGPKMRFIKCPHSTTVEHLSKYLSMRPEGSRSPELNNNENYKLYILANRSQGQYDQLSPSSKLEEVRETHKVSANKPLELYFYLPDQE